MQKCTRKVLYRLAGVPFAILDDAWQYMMSIPDQTQRAEVAEDVVHQHVFLAEKIGTGHQNMTPLKNSG